MKLFLLIVLVLLVALGHEMRVDCAAFFSMICSCEPDYWDDEKMILLVAQTGEGCPVIPKPGDDQSVYMGRITPGCETSYSRHWFKTIREAITTADKKKWKVKSIYTLNEHFTEQDISAYINYDLHRIPSKNDGWLIWSGCTWCKTEDQGVSYTCKHNCDNDWKFAITTMNIDGHNERQHPCQAGCDKCECGFQCLPLITKEENEKTLDDAPECVSEYRNQLQ